MVEHKFLEWRGSAMRKRYFGYMANLKKGGLE